MMVKILILYIILYLVYIYNSIRRKIDFEISARDLLRNFMLIMLYIIIFFGFLRLLRFFQQNQILDLKTIFSFNFFDLLLILILFFYFKRLVTMYTKLTFFRVHYYYCSPLNNKHGEKYFHFYLDYVYLNVVKYYHYVQKIHFVFIVMLVFFFFKDLIFNNFILDQSLVVLRWYGIFKFFHIMMKFVATKQDIKLDYYVYNWTYPGDYTTGYFWENWSVEVDDEFDSKENKYRFEVIAK